MPVDDAEGRSLQTAHNRIVRICTLSLAKNLDCGCTVGLSGVLQGVQLYPTSLLLGSCSCMQEDAVSHHAEKSHHCQELPSLVKAIELTLGKLDGTLVGFSRHNQTNHDLQESTDGEAGAGIDYCASSTRSTSPSSPSLQAAITALPPLPPRAPWQAPTSTSPSSSPV